VPDLCPETLTSHPLCTHISLDNFGKVMERVVYKYIYNYIIEHSLLYSYQSGFLPGYSTIYQLLEIYHNIYKNIDNRLSSIIIFCDISKAFERVWHKALIKKNAILWYHW
jgi:hypothetical protein